MAVKNCKIIMLFVMLLLKPFLCRKKLFAWCVGKGKVCNGSGYWSRYASFLIGDQLWIKEEYIC